MENKDLRVYFFSGYGGKVSCEAEMNGERYIIELDELAEDLEEQILEKGFTTSKTNRQKYPRLKINK